MFFGTSRDAALRESHSTALFSFLVSRPSLQSQKPPFICHYFKVLWEFLDGSQRTSKLSAADREGHLAAWFPP